MTRYWSELRFAFRVGWSESRLFCLVGWPLLMVSAVLWCLLFEELPE